MRWRYKGVSLHISEFIWTKRSLSTIYESSDYGWWVRCQMNICVWPVLQSQLLFKYQEKPKRQYVITWLNTWTPPKTTTNNKNKQKLLAFGHTTKNGQEVYNISSTGTNLLIVHMSLAITTGSTVPQIVTKIFWCETDQRAMLTSVAEFHYCWENVDDNPFGLSMPFHQLRIDRRGNSIWQGTPLMATAVDDQALVKSGLTCCTYQFPIHQLGKVIMDTFDWKGLGQGILIGPLEQTLSIQQHFAETFWVENQVELTRYQLNQNQAVGRNGMEWNGRKGKGIKGLLDVSFNLQLT